MTLTKEEEAVTRRLQQLELASKAREAEDFLERVEEVHETIKGLIDGTVDASKLEKQHYREALRKRAKEIQKEEAAERVRKELHMGRAGKGEGKRPYTFFCRFCLVEYELEDLRCCNRCGRELQTRAQRVGELQERVQKLKEKKHQHASRKARWRRWLQTKKILKSSRLVVDYAAWERWEPSTDEDEKRNEPPVTPADDENFQALEQDLRASARSRAGRKTSALRCKERGNALFKNGDWLGALQAYEEGLEHSRDVKQLWTNKSLVLLKMQRYTEAHEAATRILEYCEIFEEGYTSSADACFKAFIRRALANRAMRRFDDALVDLEQAVELQPKDKQAQQLLLQTQLQVDQLHQLEHLQRGLEGKTCDEGSLQSSDVCPRDSNAACVQELPEDVQKKGGSLKQPQKPQQEGRVVAPPAAPFKAADTDAPNARKAASTTKARETSASSETAVSSRAAADSVISAAASYPVNSPAAGQEPILYNAVKGVTAQEKKLGMTMTSKIDINHHGSRSDGGSQQQTVNNIQLHTRNQTAFHAVASNQTTSTATPMSPSPSSHASKIKMGDIEEQPFSDTALHSPFSPSNREQSGGVSKRSTTTVASRARPSTAELTSTVSSPLPSVSLITPSASPARPLAAINDATEALKKMQLLLRPAVTAGSFAVIEPSDIRAALKLLRFAHVKLAFCCSPLSHPSSRSSSSAGCSSGKVHQKQGFTSNGLKEESGKEDGENKNESGSGGALGTIPPQKTFVDICIANLRTAALNVRRQRRERKENTATAEHKSGIEKNNSSGEEAGTGNCDIATSCFSTHFDLYPHACFPALQLLHSICFIEETSDGTSESKNSSTVAHSRSRDKLRNIKTDTQGTSREDPSRSNSHTKCSEDVATPPWLLEVCEAAAPYLLTLTSELLYLFIQYNPSILMQKFQDSTEKTPEEVSIDNCGCHSGYTVTPHADYHACRGDKKVSSDSTANHHLENEVSSDGTFVPLCPWSACAAALATSMSLLHQLSMAPLTRRKLSAHLQRVNDGRTVLFGIPALLLCCPYEALSSSLLKTTNIPRGPPGKEQIPASAARENTLSALDELDSLTLRCNQQNKNSQSWSAVGKDFPANHLQRARRDAGALLCNMLLEQPVLHQLLQQQQQTTKYINEETLLQQREIMGSYKVSPRIALQQCSHAGRHRGDGGKIPLADVGTQLRFLLSRRLRALLAREKILQEAEKGAATLVERIMSSEFPQQLLPMLWKQAALLQQQEDQGNSTYKWRALHRENISCSLETTRNCFCKGHSLVSNSNTEVSKHNDKFLNPAQHDLTKGRTHSGELSKSVVDASQTEELINKLLLSVKEAEALEAHARVLASTKEDDPLLEEAQQALDLITNLARSSAGRIFVLTHLKEELVDLLALSSSPSAPRENVTSTNLNYLSHNGIEESQQQHRARQVHQLGASRLMQELLTPSRNNRNRRLLKAADVLGLLLNLTYPHGAFSGTSSSSGQRPQQQSMLTSGDILASLQQQFLLSGERQYGLLPLLLPHVDKLINEYQKKLSPASKGFTVNPKARATTENEGVQSVTAGLRSLTIINRLISAVATVTADAPSALAVKGHGAIVAGEQQVCKRNNVALSSIEQSLVLMAIPGQKTISAVGDSVDMRPVTRQRGLIRCLLPRISKLLMPPSSSQHGRHHHQQKVSEQENFLCLQQQTMSGEKDSPDWTEVHSASLLVLCALANMSVDRLLETAAITSSTLDACDHSNAVSAQSQSENSKGMHGQLQQRGEADKCVCHVSEQTAQQQNVNQGHNRESALQEIGRVICGWLQVLKPMHYAHERTEMRDPVAMARGNFLLLVGHLAKAQSAAIQLQPQNTDTKLPKQAEFIHSQQQLQHVELSQRVTEAERETPGDAAAVTEETVVANASTNTNAVANTAASAAESLQRQLAELDLRLCIHCCVESLRKDVEGPQKNAAIALAALARITKYRPHIDALKGFESLMQIAAPKLLGRR